MNKVAQIAFVILSACTVSTAARSPNAAIDGPRAATRTYGENYRDMALAMCIADAYKAEPSVASDVGSSVSALRDWTYYDMDNAPDALQTLVKKYLALDYRNPLADAEVKGVQFNFLKCLDLYHSDELEAQVRQFVPNPNRTYREDNAIHD